MLAAFRKRMRLGARAAAPIAGLCPGDRAKVMGRAIPGSALVTAPITGRSCVFYSVQIGEWFNGTKTPLLSEQSSEPFRLADDSGSLYVAAEGSEIFLHERRMRGHSGESLAEHRTLLARHGYTMLDDYGELRSLAYEEYVILPDDRICVLGEAEASLGDAEGYRDSHQVRVNASCVAACF